MRRILLLVMLALPAGAQTKVDVRQTKAPGTPTTIVLLFQSGRPVLATLGEGLVLDTSVSPPVIRATAPRPTESRLTKAGSTWSLPSSCGSPVIYRNGLRQVLGEDYTVSSGVVQFRSGLDATDPSDPSDTVVAECR